MSNQTKVWKTKTGPLQGEQAWFGDPKFALFELLHNILFCLFVTEATHLSVKTGS